MNLVCSRLPKPPKVQLHNILAQGVILANLKHDEVQTIWFDGVRDSRSVFDLAPVHYFTGQQPQLYDRILAKCLKC